MITSREAYDIAIAKTVIDCNGVCFGEFRSSGAITIAIARAITIASVLNNIEVDSPSVIL
jgi:hypothetical protein